MRLQRHIRGGEGRATTAISAILFCLASGVPGSGQPTPPQPPRTTPTRTIIPVQFNDTNGDITIGANKYPGGGNSFNMVAIQRNPRQPDAPTVISNANFTNANAVNNALSSLSNQEAMILVNASGTYGFAIGQVSAALEGFGGTSGLEGQPTIPLVFVGISGMAKGATPLERGWVTGRPVNGYLAPDSNGKYVFIQTDFVLYDLDTSNGDITIGGTKRTVAASNRASGCDGQNSFHLVIVNREVPTTVYQDITYCTGSSDNEISRLANDLNSFTGSFTNENLLVFLTTNGSPIPTNWNYGSNGDARFTWFAAMVRTLGGFYETIVSMKPGDTFSFVGTVAPPTGTRNANNRARESSSVYPEIDQGKRPTGELQGVLARSGRGNFYTPLNGDPSGFANFGFYQALASTSTDFPDMTKAPYSLTAYQYVSKNLCNTSDCNIRDSYDNLNADIDFYINTLTSLSDPNGNACPQNGTYDFCNVRTQLLLELKYVDSVRTLFTNIQTLWAGSGTTGIWDALQAVNEIQGQLNPPPSAPSQSLVSPLVNFFLGMASFIPEVGPAFGLADVAFNLASGLSTDTNGNKKIDLTSTIDMLYANAKTQFQDQQTMTGRLFEMVLQDYGKLTWLGTQLTTQATDKKSPWYWDLSTTGTLLTMMDPAITAAAYRNIMASAYTIGSYTPQTWGQLPLFAQPESYVVEINQNNSQTQVARPFSRQDGNSVPFYTPYTFPGDLTNPYNMGDPTWATLLGENVWLGISQKDTPWTYPSNFLYSPPSADIRKRLFTPAWKQVGQGVTGLGVYPPAFFNHWPFPRVACTSTYGTRENGGTSVGGCYWGSAAPAPEQLAPSAGSPLTSMTIRAKQTSSDTPRKPEVEVHLTIHNNGTADISTISINSITVQTLGIGGSTTLMSPAVPVQFTNLRPGQAAQVFLKLNVPLGVTRISISEQGAMTSGAALAPSTFRFSEGQALILR